MSHFSVLVIGDNVEDQLAPYHEFECTGEDNEYVQNVNITDEVIERYYESTNVRKMIRNTSTGELKSVYDDECYREFTEDELAEVGELWGSGSHKMSDGTFISYGSKDWKDGLGYRAKIQYIPDGWEKVEIPVNEIETLSKFTKDYFGLHPITQNETPNLESEHKYGWARYNEDGELIEAINRTNPNKKWDWYVIGGRWAGSLKLKDNAPDDYISINPSWGWDKSEVDALIRDRWTDSAPKKYIDFDGMMESADKEAAERYDNIHTSIPEMDTHRLWSEYLKEYPNDIDAARRLYNNQSTVLKSNTMGWINLDEYKVSREEFILRARARKVSAFAVVKDGEWFERGSMGWWGVVHNESDVDEWNAKVWEMIQSLDDDTLLTIVDCHT